VVAIKPLYCADAKQLTSEAKAEERDGWVDETVHVQCVDILGRTVQIREREVAVQQLANVLGLRVVNRDLALGHPKNIRLRVRSS
jgi:hypothetical protein